MSGLKSRVITLVFGEILNEREREREEAFQVRFCADGKNLLSHMTQQQVDNCLKARRMFYFFKAFIINYWEARVLLVAITVALWFERKNPRYFYLD